MNRIASDPFPVQSRPMGSCCAVPETPKKPVAPTCCGGRSDSASSPPAEDSFWWRLAVCLVAIGLIMMLGLGVNEAGDAGVPLTFRDAEYWWLHGAMIAAAVGSVALLGGELLAESFRAWFRLRITVESLFVASAAGAFALSLAATLAGRGAPVYYDTVPLVVVIYAVGRRIGRYSRGRALAAVAALRRTFDTARVRRPGGAEETLPVSAVTAHDTVLVAPGGAIPVDGVIVEGRGYILEAAMTGEALPVPRGPGDAVSAGTFSRDGALLVRPSAGPRRLDAILAAVEEAKATPSRYQERADAVIRWFFPLVMGCALATFLGWAVFGRDLRAGFEHAMAVLLVACPCALGIATPIAIWSGLFKLSRLGLVSKHADFIGRLAAADRVVFDKTGTLSHSDLSLDRFAVSPGFAERRGRVAALLRAVQARVNHPIARAFAALDAPPSEQERVAAVEVSVVPGAGIRAAVTDDCGDTHALRVGERTLVGDRVADALDVLAAADAGGKRVYASIGDEPAALIVLRESFRDDAADVLRELESLGLKTAVLTGDASARGREVVGAATEAGLSPAEKAARIAAWKTAGETVIFVGDGLNDAAALSGADAAVAMGEGTDLARSAAHAVLTGDRLTLLPRAVVLCRRIDRTLKGNLLWAAAYNVGGIALAASGRLTPVWAALIMTVSSAFVSWRAAKSAGMME